MEYFRSDFALIKTTENSMACFCKVDLKKFRHDFALFRMVDTSFFLKFEREQTQLAAPAAGAPDEILIVVITVKNNPNLEAVAKSFKYYSDVPNRRISNPHRIRVSRDRPFEILIIF